MKLNKKSLIEAVLAYFGRCPDRTRLRWGRILGRLLPLIMKKRVHIVNTNLKLCFPEQGPDAIKALTKRHFHLLAQSFIDRGLCWYGSQQRIIDTIELRGTEHISKLLEQNQRILMFAPHFIALDAAATRLTIFLQESATLYTTQSDQAANEIMLSGRSRFNKVHMVSRQDGVRGLIRHLRKGIPVYYLPDMDFGRKGSAFVPFFGVPAATLLSAAQIAAAWDAKVIPITSQLDLNTGKYIVNIGPAVNDFPGQDKPEQATARLNRIIEAAVMDDIAQYYWVHRRFKTRPTGEPSVY